MKSDGVYKRDQVVGIINSVLGKIRAPESVSHELLVQELSELKNIILSLRGQLHAAQPVDIKRNIPNAKDELDAVISATEQATFGIMENCENALKALKGVPADVSKVIENHLVKIIEACTFQDITGQRIKKVMSYLKEIDAKTTTVLAALEGELIELNSKAEPAEEKSTSLLNGPALPQNAVTQDDIDKLLAEIDARNPAG